MDEVGDATECWVCADTYTDARILPCGHTFCLRCLTEIHKTLIPKEELGCPFCRQVFSVPKDGLAALPKNYSLTKLIEASRPSDPCDKHRTRSLEMYCVDCSSVICVRCLGDIHQLHQCCSIDKAADVYRQTLRGYALRCSGFASSARSHRRITTDRSTASLLSIERADIRVRERAKELKQLVDSHARMLLRELDLRRQTAWMEVQVQFEKFLGHIEELERFKKFCNEAEKYSSIELCRIACHLESREAELKNRHNAHIAGYVTGRGQPVETVFKDACFDEVLNSERNNIVGQIEAHVNQPLRRVKVTQNYESQLEEELTLQVGDVIDVVKQNDSEKWQGILNGKIGMFPVSFVEVINQLSEDQSVQLARVLHPYRAQNEDELDLVEGDTVTVLCDESAFYTDGWLVGTIDGKMGVFPGNYVEILETENPENLTECDMVRTTPNVAAEVTTNVTNSAKTPFSGLNPQNGRVVRQHVPNPEGTDELHLRVGDVIKVLCQDSPYEGWWTGETDDSIGVFPWYCAQLLPQDSENHTTSPLRSPIEHPSKSSNCSPTSTATPKKVGSTPDTPTATCPSVEMDDAVKQNEDNVKEPGTAEKTKDIRQPQDNGQPRDNGQPEENRHPSVIMDQPSTAMGQPHSLDAKAQTPIAEPEVTLEVATTRETKFSHLEERAERVQTKACEAMSPEDTELKRVQLFQPKRKLRAKVVFDYNKQYEDELDLRVGDIITVLNQNLVDEGWWKGELNGNVGIFPDNFVKLLRKDSKNTARSCASSELKTASSKESAAASEPNRRTFQVRIFTDDPQILRLSKGFLSSGKSSLMNS